VSSPATRVALIHALPQSVDPVNAEFDRTWPQCMRMNLLDDSLSTDLARSGGALDDAMTRRFMTLAQYAVDTGAQAILFSCSAFGPCIDAVARRWPDIPVLKPGEAMIADAVRIGRRIALVASFPPTLASMPAEFPTGVEVIPTLASGALEALASGDTARHDQAVADAAKTAVENGCDVVALAQFSIARAAPLVKQTVGAPVLTTVASAVAALRSRLAG